MQQHIFQINEIFESIEGETTFSGFPSLFIRFTGCNLRCNYCDTKYAYSEGKFYSTEQIIELIKGSNKKYIIITGGEPLIQKGIEYLIMEIGKTDKIIIIETNGSMPIDNILGNSTIVMMDIKTPSSNMAKFNNLENIRKLRSFDEVKFTILNYDDFIWSVDIVRNIIDNRCKVNFSPVNNILKPSLLAKWILDSDENIRLNLQLHKIIWKNKERGI